MAGFFKDIALPLIGTFFVGALGWLLTHFALNPILRFFRMREQAHEAIEFNDNVSDREADEKRYDDACDEIRRIGVQLRAFHRSANFTVRWFLWRLGYNPKAAGSGLIGLSNSLDNKIGDKGSHRWDVENALKLPLSYKERPKLRE